MKSVNQDVREGWDEVRRRLVRLASHTLCDHFAERVAQSHVMEIRMC
jgi:hypothetical protein